MSETVGETDVSPPPPLPPVIVDGGGDEVIEERKSVDKLEIEKEEKKQMLGGGGEVEKKKKALEEAALTGENKRRVPPIGGIKIPGFLTSKRNSKSNHTKSKDGEDGEEKADLLETPSTDAKSPQSDQSTDRNGEKAEQQSAASAFFARMGKLKSNVAIPKCVTNIPVPAFVRRKKNPDVEDGSGPTAQETTQEETQPKRPKLINAIRLPLASLVPKKLKSKEGDETQQAGLASVETLDETRETENKSDGMANVPLDVVQIDPEKAALEEEETKRGNRRNWRRYWNLIKNYKLTSCGILIFIILLIILIIAILSGPSVPTHAPIIDGKYVSAVTSCGLVEGIMEHGAFAFRGIPYARPPVNELRFRPPQMMQLEDCWNGTLKTHNATPSCWQVFTNGSLDGQEDCLTMDIMTPAVRYDDPLPVVVIIGSDSLLGGWPSKMVVSPKIARMKDIVIVRPNIRLGIMGFLAARPLSQSTYPRSSGNNLKVYPRTSGNYGLADLVHALEWVQLNIAHFGGDSRSVTVFGYRSGATLGALLTTIRKPEKLFKQLWLSSPTTVFPTASLLESEGRSDGYIASLGCNEPPNEAAQADCLRKQDIEDLISAIPQNWRPKPDGVLPKGPAQEHQWLVQDGHLVRQHPHDVWKEKANSWNYPLSIVIGTTLHSEISPEWYAARKDWTPGRVKQEVADSQIGAEKLTDKMLNFYNGSVLGLAAMISDIATICPVYAMHKLMPNSKFYIVTEPVDSVSNSGLVYGGSDIDVILGTFPFRTEPPQRRFVAVMRNAFYNFVALGRSLNFRHNKIGQDSEKLDTLELERRCALWKDVGFDKFAKLE